MKATFHRRAALLLCSVLALMMPAQEDKRLTVYTPQSSFTVPVTDVQGREYVRLMDIVQPLGGAEGKLEGDKFKLRFGGDESQFQGGKSKVKVRGKNVDLGAPVSIENGAVKVPVHSLGVLLPRLLNATVDFREQARRVILAGAATDFTAELQANPSRLVLHFSRPVNPSIATQAGQVRMTFSKDPVVGAAATQNFGDKLITSASFAEHNGAAELTVSATAPLLASFSDENRTVTLAAAPQAAAAAPARPTPTTNAPAATAPAVPTTAAKPSAPPTPLAPRPRFLVVIDPAHGGDDRGALLAAGVEEKEVTLAFARRLRAALENDGITSVLLRDGDATIPPEQRAISANTARAAVYISVHAGNVGRGARVYTARMQESTAKSGAMLPWDTAQAGFLEESKSLAANIATELTKREIEHGEAPAQLRPLNHVTSAAIAVEFLPNQDGVASLAVVKYQQTLCGAIADAIAASRRTLEASR